ncbi:hypothetical protein DY000_02022612 [Brassica cretica]|uniref:Uncharacterized protein n=1 Tax=Brassica cretica TaxID=69181 RepID=A0ABQ7E7A2_BRACR|nr:hypothetical protein DY000_02022612 [Brassica cretica]
MFGSCLDSSELAVSKAERISTWAGRSARAVGRSAKAGGRSDRTSCVLTWPTSSESLRILALKKYPKEKSMIGSNKEARSSAQSPVHALVKLDGKAKLQYGQIGHPTMVPAKAPFRTYAGRSSTQHGQSVRHGEKHEPQLKCSERPELHAKLVLCTDQWTAAHQ